SGAVVKVRSVPSIQKTQPAGTRPVRPSGVGGGIGASNGSTPGGDASANVIAIGGAVGGRLDCRGSASVVQIGSPFHRLGVSAPSSGKTFSPPVLMQTDPRPSTRSVPSASTVAWSPGIEYRAPSIIRNVRPVFSGSL